ncbi:MAG TPA: hypothetical protein VFA60_05765 [Terriglobales bacterium]|nr:hypothetical protein [Terriglobales bacterium]
MRMFIRFSIAVVYGEQWAPGGVPVQVSAYTNWAGAYSTRGPLIVVASLPAAHDGSSGFEVLFHEAMHQWDGPLLDRFRKGAGAIGKIPNGLTHALIFYTAGYVTREIVGSSHAPYADANGIWQGGMGQFRAALDTHWKPYLEGKTTLDEAVIAVLRASGG